MKVGEMVRQTFESLIGRTSRASADRGGYNMYTYVLAIL